jgi:predicted kinase
MLDPLSAISLASSIVQFVDFTSKVVSGARELRNSEKGSTAANQELDDLASDIKTYVQKIQYTEDSIKGTEASGNSETLKRLSQQCEKIASDLLEVLGRLKLKDNRRGWNSVHKALLTAWKQSEIDELQKRLDRIQHELHNQVSERGQHEIDKKLKELLVGNENLSGNRDKELKSLQRETATAFEQLNRQHQMDREAMSAWSQLILSSQQGKEYSMEQRILNALYFQSISYRHDSISKEHSQTFQWIFEKQEANSKKQKAKSEIPRPSVNFAEWLATPNSTLYWVSGKPGSGKSTLMKYLANEPGVMELLEEWAGDNKLIAAEFYFWSSGDSLQKSALGLLRSVLFQILRGCPDLIQDAFPRHWGSDASLGISHFVLEFQRIEDLLDSFRRIVPLLSQQKVRFAFFIDGLDEYDGKPADIISIIDLLHEGSNVKACVSSRPWNEFKASFGAENPWKLYVHDLTREDIRLYTEDLLGGHKEFKQMRSFEEGCLDLINGIVDGAQGVFLWVVLVVHSLLEGIIHGEGIRDLKKRLDEIPNDLEEYFEKILNSVDDRYRQETAHTFRLLLEAQWHPSLLGYWFVDEYDLDSVLKMPMSTVSSSKMEYCIKQMERRINARSKGLLQIQYAGHTTYEVEGLVLFPRVDFLHRTVRDFLMIAKMRELLLQWSSGSFNANLVACQAGLAILKTYPTRGDIFTLHSPLSTIISGFFMDLRLLAQIPSVDKAVIALTDDLIFGLKEHRLRGAILEELPGIFNDVVLPRSPEVDVDLLIIFIAIATGDVNLLRLRLVDIKPSMLSNLELFSQSFFLLREPRNDKEIVTLLLARGLDATQAARIIFGPYQKLDTLEFDWHIEKLTKSRVFYDTIKLLLDKNADIACIKFVSEKGKSVYASDILKEILSVEQFKSLNLPETKTEDLKTKCNHQKLDNHAEASQAKQKIYRNLKSRIRKLAFRTHS